MTLYSTVNAVLAAYPLMGSNTLLNSAWIAGTIERVSRTIDARLAARYTVPFSPAPSLVERMTTDLSVQAFLVQRAFTQQQANDSEWPTRWAAWAERMLEALAAGDASLVDSSGAVIAPRATAIPWSDTSAYTAPINYLSWERQQIDPDRIEDDAINRR